jgi:uncharacterized membrane protein YvlD (DUF360 family)
MNIIAKTGVASFALLAVGSLLTGIIINGYGEALLTGFVVGLLPILFRRL